MDGLIILTHLLSTIPDNGIFVECGAWLGKSSSYLCDKAKDRVKIFVVDSWQGSKDEINTAHKLATQQDIYSIFLNNMGNRQFTPIKKLSQEAVLDFEDDSCDVVFIDMSHSYEDVLQDIEMWLPKVKTGGYLAGHDYNTYWPGVIQAVNKVFGIPPNSNLTTQDTCWIYHKK
jgi:predicted O-methyltransferase YrrM